MKDKKIGEKSIDLISLVNSHEKPFVVINKNYQIMAVNAAYEKEYNIVLKESVGKMCYQVIRGRDTPCKQGGDECPHHDIFTSPVINQAPMHYDATHHSRQVNITAFPLKGSDNELYLGKCVDVVPQITNYFISSERMVGQSQCFSKCVRLLGVASNSDVPVLLNGDTGTGKELAASYIHQHSSRSSSPFQIIDCTVLSEDSFESEMYGHVTGAFSGCVGDKLGLFEMSDGGTIFLDKIGDLKLSLQSKLLRILESGMFRRVGGTKMRNTDVRIICATNKNLWELVAEGKFREDLYHRIACLNIRIPALSERMEDIPVISQALLDGINEAGGTSYYILPDTYECLKEYTYSGNIRELKNIIFIASTQCNGDEISVEIIKNVLKSRHSTVDSAIAGQLDNMIPTINQIIEHSSASASLNEIECLHMTELLKKYNGSRKECADALGISVRTLYRKLKKLGLSNPGD